MIIINEWLPTKIPRVWLPARICLRDPNKAETPINAGWDSNKPTLLANSLGIARLTVFWVTEISIVFWLWQLSTPYPGPPQPGVELWFFSLEVHRSTIVPPLFKLHQVTLSGRSKCPCWRYVGVFAYYKLKVQGSNPGWSCLLIR